MRFFAATALSLAMSSPAFAQDDRDGGEADVALDEVAAVAPALARYTREILIQSVWTRPGLTPRDRSLVTVAALVARNQTAEMAWHFDLALENGVTPAELSEIVTHLAFYSGWGNATVALPYMRAAFRNHGVTPDQLPPAEPALMGITPEAEARRAAAVQSSTGPVSQTLVNDTASILFHDLWLRPDLLPRDRSLITVSALIASGQVAQIPFHLNRAMDNGLTRAQSAEVVSHLAFYAGWPNAMSAVPVMKTVFEARAQDGESRAAP